MQLGATCRRSVNISACLHAAQNTPREKHRSAFRNPSHREPSHPCHAEDKNFYSRFSPLWRVALDYRYIFAVSTWQGSCVTKPSKGDLGCSHQSMSAMVRER